MQSENYLDTFFSVLQAMLTSRDSEHVIPYKQATYLWWTQTYVVWLYFLGFISPIVGH